MTGPAVFAGVVSELGDLPRCTLRIDRTACGERAHRWIRGRGCCGRGQVELLCEPCELRLRWWFALGVRFRCSGCAAVSDSLETLFPGSGPLESIAQQADPDRR